MDSHNVGRNRNSIADALKLIKANTLVIGIENDFLFPISEQKYLADHIEDAEFVSIHSEYGHDGFLIETNALTNIISTFMKESRKKKVIKLQYTA